MGRIRKKKKAATIFDGDDARDDGADDVPKDEAGRLKIKHQYAELLGIRVHKLKGRILNRERINKSVEGIYFICVDCEQICHNLDEGLVEDEENVTNRCGACAKKKGIPVPPIPSPQEAA